MMVLKTWMTAGLACIALACSSSEAPTEPIEPRCPSYGTVHTEAFMDLQSIAGTAADGPFFMLNLIAFREKACYEDGRETELTGREADELYAPLDFLAEIGAAPRFAANADTTLIGDGQTWDQVAIVEYPSAKAFFSMVNDPEFQARAIHKTAGVARTLVMRSKLMPSPLAEDFMPAPSPYPTTPEDPAIEVVQLMKYRDQAEYPSDSEHPAASGEEAVALYNKSATTAATKLGAYPTASFEVNAVLIGDDRNWDELWIDHMPSGAAFQAHLSDPDRLQAEVHLEAGLQDAYTVLTLPLLNSLDPL